MHISGQKLQAAPNVHVAMAQMLITFQTNKKPNKQSPRFTIRPQNSRCPIPLASSPQRTRNFTLPVGLHPSLALGANFALAASVATATAASQPLHDTCQLPGVTSLWLAETLALGVLVLQDHRPLVQQEHEAVTDET